MLVVPSEWRKLTRLHQDPRQHPLWHGATSPSQFSPKIQSLCSGRAVLPSFDHCNRIYWKGGVYLWSILSLILMYIGAHRHKPSLTNRSELKTTAVKLHCGSMLKLNLNFQITMSLKCFSTSGGAKILWPFIHSFMEVTDQSLLFYPHWGIFCCQAKIHPSISYFNEQS